MAPEKKVTEMVIKVDLDCEKCRKEIKKILCDIPQIQSQLYDEKANTVTITVVCCSPEKIKCKICSKGGEMVKGIEIKVPEKPKRPEKTKKSEKPNDHEQPEETNQPEEKKEPANLQPDMPKQPDPVPICAPAQPPAVRPVCCRECYEGLRGGPCYGGYEPCGRPAPPAKPPKEPEKIKQPDHFPICQPVQLPTVRPVCCSECYEGRGGGPCYGGYEPYGRPARPANPPKQPEKLKQPDPFPICRPVQPRAVRPVCCSECYEGRGGGPCYGGCEPYGRPARPAKPPKQPEKLKQLDNFPICPPVQPPAVRPVCCSECYEGRGGGPCYGGYEPYGRPAPPCYEGYGRPVYDNVGCHRPGYNVSRCDYYLSEENPQGCIIM